MATSAPQGTWHDYQSYPRARARLNRMQDATFQLDHLNQTATLLRVFSSWQVGRMAPFDGVAACT